MAPARILIVGCSIAGPTLASFLLLSSLPASEKPHITILERSATFRKAGQNIDVRGAGVTIIRMLGIEHAIRSSTTAEEGVQFVDAEDRVRGAFAVDKSGTTQGPTSDIEIRRGRLAEICWKRGQTISEDVKKEGGHGIEYIFGDTIAHMNDNVAHVQVQFARSGEIQDFDLVVGADGLQSGTRNLRWGPEGESVRVKRLGMYIGFFSMPRESTDSNWRRWFHAPGRRGIMLRPSEQHDRTTVLMSVINDTDERLVEAAKRSAGALQAQKDLFQEYFRDAGWESERVVREMMASDDFYYDMVAQVKMDKWSKGRVVLLGDAGYCASPISGMGTTLALSGAYNLAGALLNHPDDHTAAFRDYEETMRPVVSRAQKLFPGAPHILNPATARGVQMLHYIMAFLTWSRIAKLLFMFAGPPANHVPVKNYGFQQSPEWKEF